MHACPRPPSQQQLALQPSWPLAMPPTPAAGAPPTQALEASIAAITGSGEAVQATLKTLAKILGNIVREPAEPKFRVLKLKNKTVAAHITSSPGALVLLDVVGFGNDGTVLALGASNDMQLLTAAVKLVNERRQRIFVRWLPCVRCRHTSVPMRTTSGGRTGGQSLLAVGYTHTCLTWQLGWLWLGLSARPGAMRRRSGSPECTTDALCLGADTDGTTLHIARSEVEGGGATVAC
jgi:hypothetical protein